MNAECLQIFFKRLCQIELAGQGPCPTNPALLLSYICVNPRFFADNRYHRRFACMRGASVVLLGGVVSGLLLAVLTHAACLEGR